MDEWEQVWGWFSVAGKGVWRAEGATEDYSRALRICLARASVRRI